MSIELMRYIDYWLGIPLCLLLTMMHYILRLFSFKKGSSNHPKILFIKLSEMGSIILAYPLIKQARKTYSKAEIFFLTFSKNASLPQVLDIASNRNILSIREDSIHLFIYDTLRVIMRLSKENIDIAFDLEFFSRFTAILTYLSRAHRRIGLYRYTMKGPYRGNLLTHNVQYNPLLHISKTYLSLWQAAGRETKFTPELEEKIEDKDIRMPEFIIPEEEKGKIWSKLKDIGVNEGVRLILVNPGEGIIPLREWPLDNFIFLSRKLLEDGKNFILIIGAKGASYKAEMICKSVDNMRCLDLTDKTELNEVLSIFNIAAALITNDCGLAHLASLTPIKKFILFGPESPQVYSPLGQNTRIIYSDLPCSPCLSAFNYRNSACRDNRCLKIIKPDEVYELIKANL